MREIKFRGHTGATWVYGNLIQFKDSFGKDHAQIEETVWDDFGCWNVDPESVGQFTGLKDRNGREIFEGDIIPYEWGDGSTTNEMVCFEDGCFWLRDQAFIDIPKTLQKSEIIGNTFENPNLI